MNKRTMPSKDKNLILAFGSLAILMVGFAVIGAFRSYSPVPLWDMWGGTLEFIMRVNEGENTNWWAQHNEHRILLSRLLFWIDFKFFGGASWFLITVNYFLIGAGALLFYRILRMSVATEKPGSGEIILGFFMTAWLFLWIQKENLTWGFQSPFIMAQLLPLCALYWLHKSVTGIHAGRYFLIACGFGLVSVGTMANGILALPLMTFYALLTRQGLLRFGVLTTLSVATLFFYFHDYRAPAHHGTPLQALRENPLGFLHYILLYLGSPFYYLFGQGPFGKFIASIAGFFLISSSALFAFNALRKPKELSLQLAILFFILYIGGTVFGTAGGRLLFGVNQALASRYTTPALMAWSALLVLYSPVILTGLRTRGAIVLLAFAVLGIPMILAQFKALESLDGVLFERNISALALELGIKDQRQIKHVFPSYKAALSIAEKASIHNLSIFGMYPYRGAREQLGTSIEQPTFPLCQGSLDKVEPTDNDARFIRVSGWIFNPAGKTYPQVIRFLGSQGKVVGYALTGKARFDVADAVDKKALQSGYQGYLLADQMGTVLTLQGENPFCQMQAKVPVFLFSLNWIYHD